MRPRAPELVPELVRYVWVQGLRPLRGFHVGVGVLAGAGAALLALRGASAPAPGIGPVALLAAWLVAVPLCRSWVDEDARLGYAAFWLQKPVRVLDLYAAWLVAVVVWALATIPGLALVLSPAVLIGGPTVADLVKSLILVGWIPPTLVVLGFLGSAAGARNAGLFAYGVLFVATVLPGLLEGLALSEYYRAIRTILPPVHVVEEMTYALGRDAYVEALALLWPVIVYLVIAGAAALMLALRIPLRLAASDA